MYSVSQLIASSLLLPSVFAISGPSTFKELNKLVFNDSDAYEFTPLQNFPQLGISSNDTAILKVFNVFSSHYPIKRGHITFAMDHMITKEIPKGSKMEIVSFVDDEPFYNGTVNVCEYLSFAELVCPLKAQKSRQVIKKLLRVPAEANDGRLSFIAKAVTPNDELIVHFAGIIDLINDGTEAKEDDYIHHDEL